MSATFSHPHCGSMSEVAFRQQHRTDDTNDEPSTSIKRELSTPKQAPSKLRSEFECVCVCFERTRTNFPEVSSPPHKHTEHIHQHLHHTTTGKSQRRHSPHNDTWPHHSQRRCRCRCEHRRLNPMWLTRTQRETYAPEHNYNIILSVVSFR